MKTFAIPFTVGWFVLLCFSCKENTTNPDTPSTTSFSTQSSKCLSNAFAKSGSLDSLFTYTFTDNLIVDFSVSANCCPDSNRFRVTQNMSNDTIIVSVADTAGNNCRCMCPYMIHAEVGNLSKDQYVVNAEWAALQVRSPRFILSMYIEKSEAS